MWSNITERKSQNIIQQSDFYCPQVAPRDNDLRTYANCPTMSQVAATLSDLRAEKVVARRSIGGNDLQHIKC